MSRVRDAGERNALALFMGCVAVGLIVVTIYVLYAPQVPNQIV